MKDNTPISFCCSIAPVFTTHVKGSSELIRSSMMQVRNTEEALVLAKEMCARHNDLVQEVGPRFTARDIALRILLEEMQADEPTAKRVRAALNTAQKLSHDGAPQTGSTAATTQPPPESTFQCPYCTEPSSRYCKETGRRHQSPEQRALEYWRKIYRRFALASQFITSARLSKRNSCIEDYSVELDF